MYDIYLDALLVQFPVAICISAELEPKVLMPRHALIR
jgi:hypothetical protein